MTSNLLIFLVTFALFGSIFGQDQPQYCQPEDQNEFQDCTQKFLTKYTNVPQSQIWNQMFLSDALYNKFVTATSLTDVATLCNALTNFYQCVDTVFDRCLSPLGWISQGKSPAQAYINDGVLRQWAFMCGAGFEVLRDTTAFTCIQRTFANNYDALYNQALRAYQASVAYDPSHACNYTKILQTSWAAVVSNTTCYQQKREHQASFFGCGAALEYVNAQFRHCAHQNTCAWTARWTWTSQFLKVEDGVKKLRIPTYHDQNEKGEWVEVQEHWVPLKE
uniref:Secreted protein n=1 Tax=Panagrolaimus sp. JU765 TaxID=591449 RepID=A0AC34PY50_9BILA